MPYVYRKARTKPVPTGSKTVTRRGIEGIAWTDARGNDRWATLHADGKRVVIEDSNWTIQFTDATGRLREIGSGTSSRAIAEEIAAKITLDRARKRHGLADDSQDRYAKLGNAPILDHVRGSAGHIGYIEALRSKGTSDGHIAKSERIITDVLKRAGINTLYDLSAAPVAKVIRETRRPDGKLVGNATRNSYARIMRAFARWLWRERRSREHLLIDLPLVSEDVGRKLFRRALEPQELSLIIAQAERTPVVSFEKRVASRSKKLSQRTVRVRTYKAAMPERAWAYRLAAGTGLRRGELARLTPENFALNGKAPTVVAEAGYSKRRRRDVQPLQRTLAESLKEWLSTKPKGKPVLYLNRISDALRADITAARVRWIEEAKAAKERREREESDFLRPINAQGERIDLHALRHTYITAIVGGGADLKTAQSLARHSTASLTLGVYAHAQEQARTAAVERLPRV